MEKTLIISVILFSIFLSGCGVDINANVSVRSGGVENDYVEEPLTSYSQKYERALAVSNQAVENLINHDYVSLFEQGFSQELKNSIKLGQAQA